MYLKCNAKRYLCSKTTITWVQRNTVVTAIFSEMYLFCGFESMKHVYIICENILNVLLIFLQYIKLGILSYLTSVNSLNATLS